MNSGASTTHTQQFPWVPGPKRGAWVAERVEPQRWHASSGAPQRDASQPALSFLVPSGYDALVRVLHPFARDRPIGASWPEYEGQVAEMQASGQWGELPQIESESVGWAETAAALVNTEPAEVAPGALSYRGVGLTSYGEQLDRVAADGYRYMMPAEGRLDLALLEHVARVLAAHTATPNGGTAAVWEGYAGLVSGRGVGYFGWSGKNRTGSAWWVRLRERWFMRTLPFRARRRQFGTRAALLALMGLHPAGSGLLSKQAATGPRLDLPDRAYICFEAAVQDFAIAGWPQRAPWLDPGEKNHHAQTPNLLWPEGREWFLVSEIDFDSTLIACSRACGDAMLAEPGIEAQEIDRDTPLW